jgi:uncharacterized protein YqgC (DUF456 family)
MEPILFALFLLLCLFLVPLGLPGTWLMIAGGIGYGYLVDGGGIGAITIIGTTLLALIGEIAEFTVTARYTTKYGGSRRAGWGAIIGGMVGAVMGVPVPVVGSVIGAFVGSFVGALVFEYTRHQEAGTATRVATGALIGRVAATALKVALGCVMAVWLVLAVL